MTKPSPRKPPVFFDSDDEQEDLDLFCKIEKFLQNDNTIDESLIQKQEEQSRLASQFPTSFVQHSIDENNPDFDENNFYVNKECNIPRSELVQFHESYKELQNKLNYISMKEKEIEKQSNWITQEKKEVERARKRVEEDRVIAEANLSNIELIELRKKYQSLQAKYEKEKNEWLMEKQSLLSVIQQLKGNSDVNAVEINNFIPDSNRSKNKSLHVDFNLKNDGIENSSQNNVAPDESYSSNVQSFQSFKTSSSSSSKKSTSNTKKSIQVSVFNGTPLHPGYKLDLLFDPGPVIKEESRPNDKRKLLRYRNNLTATLFPNGTRKMKYKDNVFIFYANGDTAQEFPDGARGYRYAETGAVELQLPDKTMYYDFPEEVPTKQKSSSSRQSNTRQREIHYPDGKKEILYPSGQRKILHHNGDYEIYYPSGKIEKCVNGHILNTLEY